MILPTSNNCPIPPVPLLSSPVLLLYTVSLQIYSYSPGQTFFHNILSIHHPLMYLFPAILFSSVLSHNTFTIPSLSLLPMIYVKKNATIGEFCVPFFYEELHRTFMVCAGSGWIRNCGAFCQTCHNFCQMCCNSANVTCRIFTQPLL